MKQNMQNQMGIGVEIIEQVWEKLRPYELPKLREMPSQRIIVVKGSYDNVEKILQNAKIPHTRLDVFPKAKEFKKNGKYKDSKIIFVNCDDSYHDDYDPLEEKGLTRENKKGLIEFIENGGRMVTTDWAQKVIRKLFNNLNAREECLPECVVNIQFPNYIGKNLLGINYKGAKPQWWIEEASDTIKPKKNSKILELITSNELKKKHGSKYVAIGFKQGKGEVFHFVSHLVAQKFRHESARDKQNLQAFLDQTKTKIKKTKSTKYVTLGGIETTYTLMNTVLELIRKSPILGK